MLLLHCICSHYIGRT
uniref:Uncharacterized protein n=1 Tax=Arundo donax TaxID=35708 RepID=A0A0A8ZJY4_ARUDO